MTNIAERVNAIIKDCLNGKEEGALIIEGLVRKFGFSPAKISEHKEEIRALLNEMPDNFHAGKGGGWSFLNLCMDKAGNQWGEQLDMEALVCLGIAAGMATWGLRMMQEFLPGGVPYVTFDIREHAQTT